MKNYVLKNEKFKNQKLYINLKSLFFNKKYKQFIHSSSKYLIYNPNDFRVLFMLAKSYRVLGMFNETIKYLKMCLNSDESKTYNYALTELFYVYYYQNKYKEALELLPIMYEKKLMSNYSLSICELVIKYNLNIYYDYEDKKSDYIKSQIVYYDKDLALKYIKRHTPPEKEESGLSYFNEIDINYLYEAVLENLDESTKVNVNDILDIYYFGINNIGYHGDTNNVCDYIKVVVVPNTKNIISLYPVITPDITDVKPLEYDYDRLFKREKVKRISQIDKFNNRYKII